MSVFTRRRTDWSDQAIRNLVTLAALWVLTASLNAYIIVPASVFSVIIERLGISAVAAGWLVSIMFLGQVLSSVPTGIALDHGNNALGVAVATGLALLVFVVGWWTARTGQFTLLLASRVVGGFCFVLLWNAGTNVIGSLFRPSRRATAIGIFTSSAPAGFAIGQFTGPVIAETVGWPAVFVAYAVPAVLGYGVFWATTRGIDLETGGDGVPTNTEFRRVLTDTTVWYVAAIGFMAISLYVFVNSWMPTFLVKQRGMSLANSGLLIGVFAFGGVLSRSGGGVLSDRLFAGRRRPVIVITFLVSTPLILSVVWIHEVVVIVGVLALAGFFVQLATGIFFTHIQAVIDDAVTGTSIALLTGIINVGAFLTPILVGYLIGLHSFVAAFAYAGVVGVVGLGMAASLPE